MTHVKPADLKHSLYFFGHSFLSHWKSKRGSRKAAADPLPWGCCSLTFFRIQTAPWNKSLPQPLGSHIWLSVSMLVNVYSVHPQDPTPSRRLFWPDASRTSYFAKKCTVATMSESCRLWYIVLDALTGIIYLKAFRYRICIAESKENCLKHVGKFWVVSIARVLRAKITVWFWGMP